MQEALNSLPALPQSGEEREASVQLDGSRVGSDFFAKSADATVNVIDSSMELAPPAAGLQWAMYQLGPFTQDDELAAISLKLKADQLPGAFYTAWSDYSSGRWVCATVAAPQEDNAMPEPAGLLAEQLSPGGYIYVSVIAFDNEPLTLLEISWTYDGAGIVQNVEATDGSLLEEIVITWDELPGAVAYDLYFYPEESGVEQRVILAEGLLDSSFSHSELNPPGSPSEYGVVYVYQVKAQFAGGGQSEDFSLPDSGFRVIPPPQDVFATFRYSPEEIEISWLPVAGVDGYRLYRDDIVLTDIPDPLAERFVDDAGEVVLGLDPHSYHVISYLAALDSAESETVTGALADWQSFEMTGLSEVEGDVQMALYQNKPICAYYDEPASDPYGASFARTDMEQPAVVADFDHHFLDSTTDGAGGDMSLAVIDGLPSIAMWNKGDACIYYARSNNAAPSGIGNWTISKIVDQIAGPGMTLTEVDGRPAIVYCNVTSETEPGLDTGLFYGRAVVDEPLVPGDWIFHQIDADVTETDDSGILHSGTGLLVAYIASADFDGNVNRLRCATTAQGQPAQASDWNFYTLDSSSTVLNALACNMVEGFPAVAYSDAVAGGAKVLLARTAEPLPDDQSDWVSSEVLRPLPGTDAQVRELSFGIADGAPLLMFSMHDFSASTQYIYLWKSRLAAPDKSSHWFGGSISFPSDFDGDASMTVLSSGLPAVMYADYDDVSNNFQLVYLYQNALD